MAESEHQTADDRRVLDRKLEAIGWGLFFIWMGIAFLFDIGWGAGLLGVGVITVGAQIARKYVGLPLEGFWLVIGILLLVSGLWDLLKIQFSAAPTLGLLPILCIVVGVALVLSALLHRPRH